MPPLLRLSGQQIMLIGFLMVLLGFIMPWLMILGYVKSTILLGLITYAVSTAGLMFGIIGVAMWSLDKKVKDDIDEKQDTGIQYYNYDDNK
jgi:membrane protein implicated in regulation of membrane protease activity